MVIVFCRQLNQNIAHTRPKSNIMVEEFKRGGRLRKKEPIEDNGRVHITNFQFRVLPGYLFKPKFVTEQPTGLSAFMSHPCTDCRCLKVYMHGL